MNLSQDAVTRSIDILLKASEKFEEQLIEAGYKQAHNWMFALREVLYDLRRLNLLLSDMYFALDINQTPTFLQKFVNTTLYEVIPHVQGHLNELEQELLKFLPDKDTPDDSNENRLM